MVYIGFLSKIWEKIPKQYFQNVKIHSIMKIYFYLQIYGVGDKIKACTENEIETQ